MLIARRLWFERQFEKINNWLLVKNRERYGHEASLTIIDSQTMNTCESGGSRDEPDRSHLHRRRDREALDPPPLSSTQPRS